MMSDNELRQDPESECSALYGNKATGFLKLTKDIVTIMQ